MKRRLFALLLALAMVFSLAGCTQDPQPTETTAAPTETTAPPPTEPDLAALYAQAAKPIEEAENLELSVSITEKRSVGGDTYSESTTQSVALQGIGTDALTASVEETVTIGEYVYSSKEFYSQGTAYLMFDNLPFSAQLTQEDYMARIVPGVLLDETIYGEVTSQTVDNITVLTFTQPSAPEEWLVPENAEFLSAEGTASLDGDGNLTETGYTVSYQYGSTRYDLTVKVTPVVVDSMNLSSTLPASEEDYVELEYMDAPYLLLRAKHDLIQADNLTGSTIETLITQAGGAIRSRQETFNLYGTGADALTKHTANVSIQGAQGLIDEYELEETIIDGKLEYTENDDAPVSAPVSDSETEEIRGDYLDVLLEKLWHPEYIASASISDLGSVYLVELTGIDALGDTYQGNACYEFWHDADFLNNLASKYSTTQLEGYLSIDKYTQLPVAFGYSYKGIHNIDGGFYALSQQWDQTMFLSSNTAYSAITEEPLPEEEPENKATPLFYHVTGENGQEMWLLGTIHVGDERTGYLPQEIYDAFESSDALAVEFNMNAFEEATENDDSLVEQIQAAYFYPDMSMTKDHLEEELYEDAVKLLKATGNYFMNAEYLKPYFWSQSIDNFALQQGYSLVSEKGVDQRLLDRAEELGMEILDIESGIFQVQMMGNYSDDLQALLLEESLEIDSAEYCASVGELYELWCAGDEAALREELSSEVDTSEFTEEELAEYEEQKPLIDEYNKAMSYDRNDGMLDVAIRYLESGDTIFYAVGLAHLLDDVNGLVDTLRAAGYTVELVTYKN